MKTQTKETRNALTPATALSLLKKGNERFRTNLQSPRNSLEQVSITSGGQFPFATVLSCIDSRVPAELVFDQAIGDIFSIRIAGNVLSGDVLGSMEFACKLAGSLLVVVLGHSSCGAIRGACDGVELGHLTGLLQKIQPAKERVTREGVSYAAYLQSVTEANVDVVTQQIRDQSPVLKQMLSAGEIAIVQAMYSVDTGIVEFGKLRQEK